MSSLDELRQALDARTITRKIGVTHDEARLRYFLDSNTVDTLEEFARVLGEYFVHHFAFCTAPEGRLPLPEVAGRVKEILNHEYQRGNNVVIAAYRDARDGVHGGLLTILDRIAEALKKEAIELYVRETIERHVASYPCEQQADLIRQFIATCGYSLDHVDPADLPGRYRWSRAGDDRDFAWVVRQISAALQHE
jgi:hypothetical protein